MQTRSRLTLTLILTLITASGRLPAQSRHALDSDGFRCQSCIEKAGQFEDSHGISFQTLSTPASGVDTIVRTAWQRAFDLNVPHPAWAPSFGPTNQLSHWTSTVYQDTTLLRLFVFPDTTFEELSMPVVRPSGTFRTICVVIDYGNTNIPEVLETLWADAQDSINAAHVAFAQEKEYPAPLVQFEFTNVLVPAEEIDDPRFEAQVLDWLQDNGYSNDQFDLVNVLDLDAENPRGGFFQGTSFIYLGWFFQATVSGQISEGRAQALANATYGHELSHIWGWEHNWTNGVDRNPSLVWTAPVLVGWEDTDSDGTPAILDPTPYGMTIPPRAPAQVSAFSDFRTPSSVRLSWQNPMTDVNGRPLTDVTIEIHRDGELVTEVARGVEFFTDVGLTDGQRYDYALFARDSDGTLSSASRASAFAGGAPTPAPPTDPAFVRANDDNTLVMRWTNPTVNIDGTTMDDFAGLRLYLNDNLLDTFVRSSTDTTRLDSAVISRPADLSKFHLTAFDNESPPNESAVSDSILSPKSLPFFDDFEDSDNGSLRYWTTADAELFESVSFLPSRPHALRLDGWPDGGDEVVSVPLDLAVDDAEASVFSFFYQPSDEFTRTTDTLFVEFKNDRSRWVQVRMFTGAGTAGIPFRQETVRIADEDVATDASFFHFDFRIRLRSVRAGECCTPAGAFSVDDVFLGVDSTIVSAGDDPPLSLPDDFALRQNYPNPFNPETTIDYRLPQAARVTLTVYDLLGRKVAVLVDARQTAGDKTVTWNGKDDRGRDVSSGVYVYRLQGEETTLTRKMLLLK